MPYNKLHSTIIDNSLLFKVMVAYVHKHISKQY